MKSWICIATLPGSPERTLNSADVILVDHPAGTAVSPAEVYRRYPGCLVVLYTRGDDCLITSRSGLRTSARLPVAGHPAAGRLAYHRLTENRWLTAADLRAVGETA